MIEIQSMERSALKGSAIKPRKELTGLYIIEIKNKLTNNIDIIKFLLGLLFITGLAVLTINITTIAEITDSNIQPV